MNRKPIGVFDSGLGGLTAVRELRRILPGEDIVYFGDTARLPYGSRGRDTIIAYAKQDIAFLLTKGVKTVMAACGTVSTTMPDSEVANIPVAYTGVVAAAAEAAAKATKNGIVGIIGTEATIASGCYSSALRALSPGIRSVARACPLFVPLVENGHFGKDDPVAALVAAEYLQPIIEAGADTLIMGCTHYPLLEGVLRGQLGSRVKLVDPGRETADRLKERLATQGMLNGRQEGGTVQYYVTDDPSRFEYFAHIFLGHYAGGQVERVNIEEYSLELYSQSS